MDTIAARFALTGLPAPNSLPTLIDAAIDKPNDIYKEKKDCCHSIPFI